MSVTASSNSIDPLSAPFGYSTTDRNAEKRTERVPFSGESNASKMRVITSAETIKPPSTVEYHCSLSPLTPAMRGSLLDWPTVVAQWHPNTLVSHPHKGALQQSG